MAILESGLLSLIGTARRTGLFCMSSGAGAPLGAAAAAPRMTALARREFRWAWALVARGFHRIYFVQLPN
ncbi:hypothetical protein DBR42_26575 [Pelomonas sp. HMWF004]|nr:hypothetical protein DBR42_26575 [Pelomonas sp. HMWF004]